ncbi:MAG: double-strand break repair helicase AddA [Rhodospirillales bacterium]
MTSPSHTHALVRPTQQMAAADPSRSAWVAANAGTGKTHVLIDRITRLLLTGTPPNRILCLTFTKAAAAEMANRLHARLGAWAAMDDDRLNAELRALLGHAVGADNLSAARRLFAATLDVPEGLKIRTIHSFCESLLARFPLEARVAPHFSVIDDRSRAELLREARDDLFVRALKNPAGEPATALDHVAGLVDENGFASLIRELANNRAKLHALIEAHGSIEAVMAEVRRALGIPENETVDDVIPNACRNDAFDGAGLRKALGILSQASGKRDTERAGAIDRWLAEPEQRESMFNDTYVPQFLKKDMDPMAESTLLSKKIREGHPDVFDVLLDEQARIKAVIERLKAHRLAEATRALLIVGVALTETYERLKRDRVLLDYDDLILTARRLLEAENDIPWVHFKLDGGLDHILIDEAQDTSPAQWDIVARLAAEFFTGLGARDGTRTVFAVGDEKQSIFSFQGADPDAFDAMRQFFAEKCENAGQRLDKLELVMSFRSVPDVLQTVDHVFANETAREGLGARERPIRHHISRTGQAGHVELWPTLKPEDAAETDPWDAPLDQLSSESPQTRLAKRIAGQIRDWRDNKEILPATGKLIAPGDIMILVRQRTQFAEIMIRCLKECAIPVAGADRMVLTEHIAVMDMIALGHTVLLPEDDLTLATVLKSPVIGLTDDDLIALAHNRAGTLWAELRRRKDRDPFRMAYDILVALRAEADYLPPFEFYGHVLDGLNGRHKILARLGPDAADPLDEFMAAALSFEHEHVASLQGFLHWLEAGRTEIKRDLEQGRDEVRVMTVHGAKGLQAKIVFLPDTCAVPTARQDSRLLWRGGETDPLLLWPPYRDVEENLAQSLREDERHKRLQEYRRLLYVAMTRAEDRLYVCGFDSKNGRADGCWYDLIAPVIKEHGEEIALPDGEKIWRVSSPQTEDVKTPETPPAQADSPPLPAWALVPPAPEPEPVRPLSPSRPTDAEPPVFSPLGEDDGARFKRGLIVHALLQTLPDLKPTQRAGAAKTFLAETRHALSPQEQADIAQETLRVIEHSDFAFLFGADSLAEVPLVAEIDGTVISGQIDRLVVTPDRIDVVDYKTNRPPPETAAGIAALYLKQLAAYRAALGRIYPGRIVACHLLWTDGPTLMSVPEASLAPHAP